MAALSAAVLKSLKRNGVRKWECLKDARARWANASTSGGARARRELERQWPVSPARVGRSRKCKLDRDRPKSLRSKAGCFHPSPLRVPAPKSHRTGYRGKGNRPKVLSCARSESALLTHAWRRSAAGARVPPALFLCDATLQRGSDRR